MALLFFLGAGANGAVYEVGPGKTYKTLQEVTGRLQPGDTVTVDGGVTYPGGVTLGVNGGSGVITVIGKRIGGKRPVLTGGGVVMRVVGSHYVIEGFDMTVGGDPLTTRCFYNVGDDVTLKDCLVHDCRCTGIAGSDASGSLTLDGVEVCRCGNGLYAHQIYVGSSLAKYPGALFRMRNCYVHDGTGGNDVKSRVTRNEIEYNWIEGAAFHDLDLVGPDPKAQKTPPGGIHCDADIAGNVLVVTGSALGTVARLGSDGTASSRGRYRFVNNTVIVRSKRAAAFGLIWMEGEVESVGMWNNVFWGDAVPMTMVREEGTPAPAMTGEGNWVPAGTKNVPPGWKVTLGKDPGFADAEAGDYRLAKGSVLIGAASLAPILATEAPPMIQPGEEAVRQPGQEKDIGAYGASN